MPKLSKFNFYFLSSRLFFLLCAYLAAFPIPLREGYLGTQLDKSLPYLVAVWANFDGRHFISIAGVGYQHTNFAYFPLYPLLISVFSKILLVPSVYVGLFISLFSYYFALRIIFKLIKLDYSKMVAYKTLLFLSFFPLAFFYHSVYADSLFLLLSSLSFYQARRGNWFLAGLFCALTILTRLSGVALLPALLVEWYIQRNRKISLNDFLKSAFVCLFIGALGLLTYMAYLQINYGDFLLFQKSMSAWNQSNFVFPPQVIWRYLKIFLSVSPSTLVYWIAVLELVTFWLYVGLAIYVWKKIRISYGMFMFILLVLITFTGTLAGTPRYLLHLFPGFIGLAILLPKNLNKFVIAIFLVLGFILTALFTRGYFIA